jgi:hypothetical protein
VGRPIAAPLQRCAELLGVDPATIRAVADRRTSSSDGFDWSSADVIIQGDAPAAR